MGMKQILVMMAAVVLGCGKKEPLPTPHTPNEDATSTKHIADIIIEKAIRKELKKSTGELTKEDCKKVIKLDLSKKRLTKLPKSLKKIPNLERLWLTQNQLTDLKGLENLTQLTELYIAGNQLVDIKCLENLTQLTRLNLSGNKLTNLKYLETLTSITNLYLSYNADLTKAQIVELQKALPNCKILSNPTK